MSTIKALNYQVGQSLTATQNFCWYQPSSPDGTVRLAVGNAGATTLDTVTVNSSGNVGIGVTPSAWGSGFKAFQVGARGSVYAGSDASMRLAYNSYYDGTGYKRIAASSASQWIADTDGAFVWFQAGSSTAGSAISFTQSMTLDSSGNLGLGVTPSAWGSSYKAIQISGGVTASIWSTGSGAFQFGNNVFTNSSSNDTYISSDYASKYYQLSGKHQWLTAPSGTAGNAITFTQAMTLDASGNLLVGTTSNPNSSKIVTSGRTIEITNDSGGIYKASTTAGTVFGALSLGASYNAAALNDIILSLDVVAGRRIYVQNRSAGVYLADGGTSWTSNSDERLKEDLIPIEDAVAKVSTLRAVIGKYKTDEPDKRRSFLIAQDVQAVLPEAVDATDPDKLGVQYTDTIPLLVAAIKELSAELNELKAKVNA